MFRRNPSGHRLKRKRPLPNWPADAVSHELVSWSQRVLEEVNKVFVGQQTLVRGVLASLLAEGHVLIESVPGLGKTLLVAFSVGSWAALSIASSLRRT